MVLPRAAIRKNKAKEISWKMLRAGGEGVGLLPRFPNYARPSTSAM